MNIILWIVLGALAGWIASIVMRTDADQGLGMDIIMGMIGAVVGGLLLGLFGLQGVTGFNLYSIAVAILGSIVVIYLGRLFRRTA